MALEPITRQEQIIAGKELEPITRMEQFLKEYGGASSWNDLTDKPFGEEEIIVLPETELTFADDAPAMFTPLASVDGSGVYDVTFDGVVYECTPISAGTALFLGNGVVAGLDDSGEPFAIMIGEENGSVMGMCISLAGNITANVSIKGVSVVRIDPKYIPKSGTIDLVALGVGTVKKSETVEAVLGDDLKKTFENQLRNIESQGLAKVCFEYSFAMERGIATLTMTISANLGEYNMVGFYYGSIIEITYKNGTISATAKSLAYGT